MKEMKDGAGSMKQAAGNGGYIVDIGIECHVQLKTKSKLFCACDNDAREAAPNTHICPICTGLPGTLPYLNEQAVLLAIKAGLALEATISDFTKFDRKNYFYPDLPKGYQITQFDQPIIVNGKVTVPVDGREITVRVERAHLEEDAGKTAHPEGKDYSLVDYNRAGTPLLEIVSAPDMHAPAEAKAYAQELYHLMRYAGVSDVDLYHGNMRFDVNLSVRKHGSKTLGTRSETKNLNSFRSIEKACEYEIKRQIELLEKGEKVMQETRGWDDIKGKTFSQRSKEEAHDYRYFPEPDLPPLVISQSLVDEIALQLPLLPLQIRANLQKLGITGKDGEALLARPEAVALLEQAVEVKTEAKHLTRIANWLKNELENISNEAEEYKIPELARLVRLSELVESGELSSTNAKVVLVEAGSSTQTIEEIIADKNLQQVSDTGALSEIVGKVLAQNPKAAADFRAGNLNSLQFLVGQVMKESRGQANPGLVQQLLREKLS